MELERHPTKYEFVPDTVSEKDVAEEANRRASKVGACTRDGLPPGRTKIMSAPPTEQYRKNYNKIDWSK
jgi:hypothetical protein